MGVELNLLKEWKEVFFVIEVRFVYLDFFSSVPSRKATKDLRAETGHTR